MNRESYTEQAQELVLNENILLQTLGFDVAIDHPHTHVVKACQLFNIVTGNIQKVLKNYQLLTRFTFFFSFFISIQFLEN